MRNRKIELDAERGPGAAIPDLRLLNRRIGVEHRLAADLVDAGVEVPAQVRQHGDKLQLKGIAQTGGLVGIGYWDTAVCGRDVKAIARAIRYTADLIGVDHVALGSDFDGSIEAPFDTTGLVQITDELLQEKFSEAEIRKLMGENAIRVFQQYLP